MFTTPNPLLKWFLLFSVAFSLQIIPRWWSDSVVMDEEWNLTASYYYLKKGDVMTSCGTTLPGALCAAPLLFMDLKMDPRTGIDWRNRSLSLLFMNNPGKLENITTWSRFVSLLLGLGIGYFLYRAVRDGPMSLGLSALALWAFEPTLLAFSGTAKTDISVVFWFFLCLLYYKQVQTHERYFHFALLGFLAGLTSATRYNGLFILPVLFTLEIFSLLDQGLSFKNFTKRIILWAFTVTGFAACILIAYFPGIFFSVKHHWPTSIFFLNMAAYVTQRKAIADQLVFFANHYWQNGSYLCFPYHFFYKNTLPFIFLLAAGGMLAFARKGILPRWIWVPPLVYLGLFWLMDKSMDIRHALPAYPFLILIAAQAFHWLWCKCQASVWCFIRFLPLILLLWHGISVLHAFPHHIAYANDLMKNTKKPGCLYSFNWNLGQDMKRLAETAKERGWRRVKLITEQRTDPYFYGLSWEPWTEQDFIKPELGTVYVVDPSIFFDHQYYGNLYTNPNGWLRYAHSSGNIGGTLYYYEIPGTWDPAQKVDSPMVNSFIYYADGIPPYKRTTPPDTWTAP